MDFTLTLIPAFSPGEKVKGYSIFSNALWDLIRLPAECIPLIYDVRKCCNYLRVVYKRMTAESFIEGEKNDCCPF